MKLEALHNLLDGDLGTQLVISSSNKRKVEADRVAFIAARNKLPPQLRGRIRIQRLSPFSQFNDSENWLLVVEGIEDEKELGMIKLPDGTELTQRQFELLLRERRQRKREEMENDS